MLRAMTDEEQAAYDGPSLDVDGRLVKRFEAAQEPPPQESGPIELAERAPTVYEPTPEAYRAEPAKPQSRRGLKLAVAAGVTAALLFAGALLFAELRPGQGVSTSLLGLGSGRRALVVISHPPGATIRVAGAIVGQTPWAGDNLWGDAEVTLELPGYRRWSGRLTHGEDVTLEAHLKR